VKGKAPLANRSVWLKVGDLKILPKIDLMKVEVFRANKGVWYRDSTNRDLVQLSTEVIFLLLWDLVLF